MASSTTAGKIVESAARELREHGVFAASLDAVRRRAGVSTGSTYHHFPGGMSAVSAEVYRSALHAYQEEAAAVLDHAGDAEAGVRAGVLHLLAWIEADADRAHLLYQLESAIDPVVVDGVARPLADAIDRWIERFGRPRAARHRAELLALWSGPAKEYGRVWTRNPSLAAPTAMGDLFADAAWKCVKPFVRPRGNSR